MEITAKRHSFDPDMVELFHREWLMGVIHIDHFLGEPCSQDLLEGFSIVLEVIEKGEDNGRDD